MGRDKAALAAPGPGAETLAERTAGLLRVVAGVALEVGPGYTSLDRVDESRPGRGPLAALAEGWGELGRRGWAGPVLVVATDLPHLTAQMLAWLAGYEPGHSVVPLAGGRFQPLCARYEPDDLDVGTRLVESGRRAMGDLVAAIEPRLVPEELWIPAAGDPDCLLDVDTPEDLDALGNGTR